MLELTAVKDALLFLLEDKFEESEASLKSIQNEIAKGHDMEITLSETVDRARRIESILERLARKGNPA